MFVIVLIQPLFLILVNLITILWLCGFVAKWIFYISPFANRMNSRFSCKLFFISLTILLMTILTIE